MKRSGYISMCDIMIVLLVYSSNNSKNRDDEVLVSELG